MNLEQIIAAEDQAGRAIRAIRPFMSEAANKDALDRASLILAEVRVFAVTWNDIRSQEDGGEATAAQATEQRQHAIQRLTSFCAPGRL